MIKQGMLTLILPLEEWLFQWIAKGGGGISPLPPLQCISRAYGNPNELAQLQKIIIILKCW